MRPETAALGNLKSWLESGDFPVPLQPATGSDILALEERYAVTLPADFRQYLLHAVPAEERWDDETTTWWPLARIRNIPDEYPHTIQNPAVASNAARYLFFADSHGWCWAWAIACTDDADRGRIAVIRGGDDKFVADSFNEFVERYLDDWTAVS